MYSAKTAPSSDAANANHLICWRVSPVEVRNRRTSEVRLSTMASPNGTSASGWRTPLLMPASIPGIVRGFSM